MKAFQSKAKHPLDNRCMVEGVRVLSEQVGIGVLKCSCGREREVPWYWSHGESPPRQQTHRLTDRPSRKLRMRAVIKRFDATLILIYGYLLTKRISFLTTSKIP